MRLSSIWFTAGACCAMASVASAADLVISRSEYADRLRGMWLGEMIANHTGRMTEGARRTPPFYTDASWGTNASVSPFTGNPIGFNFYSPWRVDDDTDVEYTYLQLMTQHGTPRLSDEQIRQGWLTHNTQSLFYSNSQARALLNRGVAAEGTGIPAANHRTHYIDAQLTTEMFGAIAPGRPDLALQYSETPMLMTSRGYATHAAQYYAAMYALAPAVPSNLTAAQKLRWLNDEARKYVPDTSKAADIIDFVVADFEANTDINNWESTRDKIYQRYQQQAASNGWVYREWTESSVNLATGVMALLYGNGDFRRTVQINSLAGWDSDNPTANLGGLFGLVFGHNHIASQFTSAELITRSNMSTHSVISDLVTTTNTGLTNHPDYLPAVSGAGDSFTMIADRMLAIADKAVIEAGGTVDLDNDQWIVPNAPGDALASSPTHQTYLRSANNQVREMGGTVTASSSATGQSVGDAANLQLIADGFEHDFSGREYTPAAKDVKWYRSTAPGNSAAIEQWLAVTYSLSVWADVVRFIEGENPASSGGAFADIRLELLVDGHWVAAPAGTVLDEALVEGQPFQIIDFRLPSPIQVQGVRVIGLPNTTNATLSAAELDVFMVPEPAALSLASLAALALGRRRRIACSR